jgi:ABC-type nickel/cobalt efflux system permease component RcnA
MPDALLEPIAGAFAGRCATSPADLPRHPTQLPRFEVAGTRSRKVWRYSGRVALMLGGVMFAGMAHAGDLPVQMSGGGFWSFLLLGFAIGMAHALEGDHLAAVTTMMTQKASRKTLMMRGAFWGLGHTLSLFLVCSVALLLGLSISGRVEAGLELAVGVMIVLLGLRVLWKLRRDKVHLHVHEHDGSRHLHAHSHAGETAPHDVSRHDHKHRRGHFATMGLGVLHGAAGSAGLMVLAVLAAPSLGQAMLYFAVFGLGTTFGMTFLTVIVAYPLDYIQRSTGWLKTATSLLIGGLAVVIGSMLAIESLPVLWG